MFLVFLFPGYCFAINESMSVARVIDGDTIVVTHNNLEERLRIIGIDTPETVAPGSTVECYGPEATAQAHTLLPIGSLISVEHELQYDKYDRLLGYVILPDGDDYGYIMIEQGYATAYQSFPHDRMDIYNIAEQSARQLQLGIWSPDACSDTTVSVVSSLPREQSLINILKIVLDITTIINRIIENINNLINH